MRQTGKYYWAICCEGDAPETVYLSYDGYFYRNSLLTRFNPRSFYWVSEEPIEEPKIPLKLKDNHYYVVEIEGAVASHKVVGRWSSVYKCFSVDGYTYGEATVKVVGGPFTADELVKIKPINQ
jgi:hypothetical protein